MSDLIFALRVVSPSAAMQAITLVQSLRTFGGRWAQVPVKVLHPRSIDPISASNRETLESLNVSIIPFKVDPAALAFPLADKPYAAAAAEELVESQTDILVWMDPHSIIIQEPELLLLPADKSLGYRPVDHTLVGSLFKEPLDAFWQLAYDHCQVPSERVFPMPTSADGNTLRPYFNASMLVVRPGKKLLQNWRDAFDSFYQKPQVEPFYQQDYRYRIFVHQILLSSSLLAGLDPAEMLLLDPRINYPLHMHAEVPAEHHPAVLNQLITGRYDMLFDDPDWRDKIPPIDEPLKSWLKAQAITQTQGAAK